MDTDLTEKLQNQSLNSTGPAIKGRDNTKLQADAQQLLRRYLASSTERDSANLLDDLVTRHVEPVARHVLERKCGVRLPALADAFKENTAHSSTPEQRDVERLPSETIEAVLRELNSRKLQEPDRRGEAKREIANFRGYVAIVATHVFDAYLRRKRPQRYRLQERLVYLFQKQRERSGELALWTAQNGSKVCGYARWERGHSSSATDAALETLLRNPKSASARHAKEAPAPSGPGLIIAVRAIFDTLQGPLEFDDLVTLVAALTDVTDEIVEEPLTEFTDYAKTNANPITEVRLGYLRSLWSEITQLQLHHRAALLLNFRDTQPEQIEDVSNTPTKNGLILFEIADIATRAEIATSLEIPVQEFSALWNELPLDDQQIARRMNASASQVSGWREKGRARLIRRMRDIPMRQFSDE